MSDVLNKFVVRSVFYAWFTAVSIFVLLQFLVFMPVKRLLEMGPLILLYWGAALFLSLPFVAMPGVVIAITFNKQAEISRCSAHGTDIVDIARPFSV